MRSFPAFVQHVWKHADAAKHSCDLITFHFSFVSFSDTQTQLHKYWLFFSYWTPGKASGVQTAAKEHKKFTFYFKIDENKNPTQCEDGAVILTGAVGRVVERFPLRKIKRTVIRMKYYWQDCFPCIFILWLADLQSKLNLSWANSIIQTTTRLITQASFFPPVCNKVFSHIWRVVPWSWCVLHRKGFRCKLWQWEHWSCDLSPQHFGQCGWRGRISKVSKWKQTKNDQPVMRQNPK